MNKFICFIVVLIFIPCLILADQFTDIDQLIVIGNPEIALKKLSEIEPKVVKKEKYLFYYYTGKAYFSLKDFNKAIENFQESMKLKPDWPYSYNNLGWAYQNINNYEKAVLNYKKAINLSKTFAIAYVNIGNVYLIQKKYDLGIQNYNIALRYEKDKSVLSEIYSGLGKIYQEQGDTSQSIDSFKKSLENNLNNWKASMNLGFIYFNDDSIDDALICFNKVVMLNKEYYPAYFYIGNCYASKKNFAEMEKYYKISLELKPDFTDALYTLSSYYAMKNKELMMKYLKNLFSVDEQYKMIIVNDSKFKKYKDDNDFKKIISGGKN